MLGAMGVMRDMPLQKYVHDALVCLHPATARATRSFESRSLVGYRRQPNTRSVVEST